MYSPVRVGLAFALGSLLLQAAWITAVPPYRGIDEFDHAYKAASVASGHWSGTWPRATNGRGELIPTSRTLVEDAYETCRLYEYVGEDNCRPVAVTGDQAVVASAAARYNPLFYWLIGTPARGLDGASAVYVMRVVAALLCSLLLGLAAATLAAWSRTRWPLTTLVVALTPMVVYSSVLPAPNGIEMMGALCLWIAGLSLASNRAQLHPWPTWIVAAVGGACLGVRTLGPFWLIAILVVLALAIGASQLRQALSRDHTRTAIVVAVLGISATLSAGWTLLARTNALEPADVPDINPWVPALREVPVWLFQSVGTFPVRDEPAPPAVYALWGVAFVALVAVGMWRACRPLRYLVVATGILSLAIPYVITVTTATTAGAVWQGRYTLPLAFGVPLLIGLALERNPTPERFDRHFLVAVGSLVALSHALSIGSVQAKQQRVSPLAGDDRWLVLPLWATLALAVGGCLTWAAAVGGPWRSWPAPDDASDERAIATARTPRSGASRDSDARESTPR